MSPRSYLSAYVTSPWFENIVLIPMLHNNFAKPPKSARLPVVFEEINGRVGIKLSDLDDPNSRVEDVIKGGDLKFSDDQFSKISLVVEVCSTVTMNKSNPKIPFRYMTCVRLKTRNTLKVGKVPVVIRPGILAQNWGDRRRKLSKHGLSVSVKYILCLTSPLIAFPHLDGQKNERRVQPLRSW